MVFDPLFVLDVITTVADLSPTLCGTNDIEAIQLPPTGTTEQSFVSAKAAGFAPDSRMPVTCSGAEAFVALVIVKICAELVPIFVTGNVRLVGDIEIIGKGATAVPVNVTDAFGAPLTTFRDAVGEPTRVGENVTVTIQFASTPRLVGQLSVCVKEESPVMPMLVIESGTVPVL